MPAQVFCPLSVEVLDRTRAVFSTSMVLRPDPQAHSQSKFQGADLEVQAVASALNFFNGSATALQALDDHLDEPAVLLKLCQNVGKQDVLQKYSADTVHSLSDAFVLGKKHQSRGVPVPEAVKHKSGLTARLLGNPHLKAYVAGYFTWPRNRVNASELQQLCLLGGKTLPHEYCKAAIASWDSMPWIARLPALHSQDLQRLCGSALSQTDQNLRQLAQESVAEELTALGISQPPKQAARESRLAQKQATADFSSAQQMQCNLCLAKIISWARDQGAVVLCRKAACATVKMVIDTSDMVETCIPKSAGSKSIRVDLALNVIMPSPAIAFGALQSGCTCTVLECLLALHTVGIQMQLWEVVLLATRYAALDTGTTYSWAADIRWPALLRDLGLTPDSPIPAGKALSLIEVVDLLTRGPPDGTLTDVQQQQVDRQVLHWEIQARRNLEAACGHSIHSASLLPYLKLAPRVEPRTSACQAVFLHMKSACDSRRNGCSEAAQDVASNDSGYEQSTTNQPSNSREDQSSLQVEIAFPVRVFLVAQEPVGHLKECVHVNIEVGDVIQDNKHHCVDKSIADKMHPVFDMPILLSWASQQLKVFKSLQRLFCAMDPHSTGACSLRDSKYVFIAVFGRFLSQEQQQTLFEAFKGSPVRDTASRVAGTHERFRYKDFMRAIKPAHVLLLHQKHQTPVLPWDNASCPLYIMCILSDRVLPGVSALHKALVESSSGFERMGRQLLDFATFRSAALTSLTCNEEQVDNLKNACRAVGSKSVCVDMVEWLLCIRLERCMSKILAEIGENE